MRNDLKDEPLEIPSLLIDDIEPKEKVTNSYETVVTTSKKSGTSKGFLLFIVLFLFVIYSSGVSILFLLFKQSTDDLRYQLEQTTHTAASADQVNQQQALTSSGLESIRNHNKLLTQKLTILTTKQDDLTKQLLDQGKRLATIEQQISLLANDAKQIDKIKQLSTDLVSLKKSQDSLSSLAGDVKALQNQNLSQTVKTMQDDVLILRAQVDKIQTTDNGKQVTENFVKKVESLQTEVGKLRQQISNISPY